LENGNEVNKVVSTCVSQLKRIDHTKTAMYRLILWQEVQYGAILSAMSNKFVNKETMTHDKFYEWLNIEKTRGNKAIKLYELNGKYTKGMYLGKSPVLMNTFCRHRLQHQIKLRHRHPILQANNQCRYPLVLLQQRQVLPPPSPPPPRSLLAPPKGDQDGDADMDGDGDEGDYSDDHNVLAVNEENGLCSQHTLRRKIR